MMVQLTRVLDDDGLVEYDFLVTEGRPGRVALRKHDGELELREACPDDPDDEILVTVAIHLRHHWRQGAFPETATIRYVR